MEEFLIRTRGSFGLSLRRGFHHNGEWGVGPESIRWREIDPVRTQQLKKSDWLGNQSSQEIGPS